MFYARDSIEETFTWVNAKARLISRLIFGAVSSAKQTKDFVKLSVRRKFNFVTK
jgi:hypothetical protein